MSQFSNPLYERTRIIVGDEAITRLHGKRVFLAGLGGVGSFAAEAIARMGVGHLTLADHDIVSGSNANRQLVALRSTIGMKKADVMAERIADINPECDVRLIDNFMRQDDIARVLAEGYDYVVDAIDSQNSKAALIETAYKMKLPVASSMGAGNRVDPTAIRVGDLQDTEICPLARRMRKGLRRRGVGRGVVCVYSVESPSAPLPPQPVTCGRDRAVNGTVSYMPGLFGLTLAGVVIRRLLDASTV